MSNKISCLILVIILSGLSVSCQSDSKQVEFLDIDDGVATFKVVNNTNDDISSIRFELTYSSANSEVIKIDTVTYTMAESEPSQIFLEASGQTYISQKVPDKTTTASCKIISINN
jgi:hypothetical protein